MTYSERQNDILKIASSLDISPSMFANAKEKYQNIANYLSKHGIEADFYPQGSFALGTVVRPSAKNPDAAYDLDFICQVKKNKEDTSASKLRNEVESILNESDLYGGKLISYDKCITIQYADVGSIGFSIDIVPAVDESQDTKDRLAKASIRPDLITMSIAIPKHCEKNYTWCTNNPKGYCKWFNEINDPFKAFSQELFRKSLFENNRAIYSSIEDIPVELERSAMQRVVQILKYHRDIYYSHQPSGDDNKPISAIIGTLVVDISKTANPSSSVFDLLEFVLRESEVYSKRQVLSENDFIAQYGNTRTIISRRDNKWYIMNPANPEDNFADQWDNNTAKLFFAWLKAAKNDLIDSMQLQDAEFRLVAENAFGSAAIKNIWGSKYEKITPTPIQNVQVAKPWRA